MLIQNKSNLNNKKLRNFIVMLSLLGTAASYGKADIIICERDVIGGASEFNRVMHRRSIITEETEALKDAQGGALGMILSSEKRKFLATRVLQEAQGENVLEIQNDNSKPLTITLLDQGSNLSTEIGVVEARSTKKFFLDRDTVYDSYSVKGYLGVLRSDICAHLSFKKFYSKIVFQNNTIGTTAQLERTADVY